MPEKTKAQKQAQKKYIAKFARVEVRMSEENADKVKEHAEKVGESVNGFINRAITETIDRDNQKTIEDDRERRYNESQMSPEERGYYLPWEKPQEDKPKPKKTYHILPGGKPDPTKF